MSQTSTGLKETLWLEDISEELRTLAPCVGQPLIRKFLKYCLKTNKFPV